MELNTRNELEFYDNKLNCCYNVIIYDISTLSSLSNRIHSLKFQRSTTSDCKDTGRSIVLQVLLELHIFTSGRSIVLQVLL